MFHFIEPRLLYDGTYEPAFLPSRQYDIECFRRAESLAENTHSRDATFRPGK